MNKIYIGIMSNMQFGTPYGMMDGYGVGYGTAILELIFWILVIIGSVLLMVRFLFRNRQQQQQQQQVIIQGDNQKRKRVCPKCGLQNDRDAKFCSDCGFKFA